MGELHDEINELSKRINAAYRRIDEARREHPEHFPLLRFPWPKSTDDPAREAE